ncbi:hypothetical protein ABVT39_027593 [Epinephelus coioides]
MAFRSLFEALDQKRGECPQPSPALPTWILPTNSRGLEPADGLSDLWACLPLPASSDVPVRTGWKWQAGPEFIQPLQAPSCAWSCLQYYDDIFHVASEWWKPFPCLQLYSSHGLSGSAEDDLKGCEKEDWGDGTPHGDAYFKLLPSCCKILEAEAHLEVPEASRKERKDLVIAEVTRIEQEELRVRSVAQGQQGQWTAWEGVASRAISWAEFWKLPQARLIFLIRSTYDTLPSPHNLHQWLGTEQSCDLCGTINASLQHVLSGYKTALTKGLLRWRHDQVLRKLSEVLEKSRQEANNQSISESRCRIHFLRRGEPAMHTSKRPPAKLLTPGAVWKMEVDLGRQLQFPQEICSTTLRRVTVLPESSRATASRDPILMGSLGASVLSWAQQVLKHFDNPGLPGANAWGETWAAPLRGELGWGLQVTLLQSRLVPSGVRTAVSQTLHPTTHPNGSPMAMAGSLSSTNVACQILSERVSAQKLGELMGYRWDQCQVPRGCKTCTGPRVYCVTHNSLRQRMKERRRLELSTESTVTKGLVGFKTKDGHIVMAAGNNKQFVKVCQVLQLMELADEPKYKTNKLRVQNRQQLLHTLSQRFLQEKTADWLKRFEGSGVPVGPINSIQDVFSDSQVKHNGLIQEMSHPTAGHIAVPGPAVQYSSFTPDKPTPPPLIGQHTMQVLRHTLSYSDDVIKALLESGAVAQNEVS